MRPHYLSVFLCLAVWAQPAPPKVAPPPDLPPETVIATFGDGKKLTFGELKRFMGVLPPQMQQMALRDRRAFVQQFALMRRLSEMAEQLKLDQQSPTKEQLEFNRMYVMMNAKLNDAMNTITVPPEEQQKFYDANKDRFTQVKVKVIYVSFRSNPHAQPGTNGKKSLTEAEAKAKIEKLLAEARAGADFVKLVKENSEDQTSATKDGDFGTIRRSDNVPEAIRTAIFSLKPGQISEPIRQPNGFYLFRAEEVSTRPFPEVKDEIVNEIRQVRFKEWMDQTNLGVNVKFENEAFFGPAPAGSAAPPAAAKK